MAVARSLLPTTIIFRICAAMLRTVQLYSVTDVLSMEEYWELLHVFAVFHWPIKCLSSGWNEYFSTRASVLFFFENHPPSVTLHRSTIHQSFKEEILW